MDYFIIQNDETRGPYTLGQLRTMWDSGIITGETMHYQEGYSDWLPMSTILHKLEPKVSVVQSSAPHSSTRDQVDIPRHESGSKRSSRRNKAIGAVMMCVSVPGFIGSAESDSEVGMMISLALFLGGIILFVIGRFQE